MCDGPGSTQTLEQRATTSAALRRYWRSPAGRVRRAEMQEEAREVRRILRARRTTRSTS